MEKIKHKKRKTILLVCALLILIAIAVIFTQFELDDITVSGNVHYTENEIKDIVLSNGKTHNTFVLWVSNKINHTKDKPFINKIDIQYLTKNKISIEVIEKPLAGCLENMGDYIYFDRDGMVLESSTEKFEDIPCVTGLKVDYFILGEKLPIEDTKKFDLILAVTKLINEYSVEVDKVYFNISDNLILYKGDLRIDLGKGDKIEEQLAVLPAIIEQAEASGATGTLKMEKYSWETNTIPLKPKK